MFVGFYVFKSIGQTSRDDLGARCLPLSPTSYPDCVIHFANCDLVPTLVFLPKMHPSSFTLSENIEESPVIVKSGVETYLQ